MLYLLFLFLDAIEVKITIISKNKNLLRLQSFGLGVNFIHALSRLGRRTDIEKCSKYFVHIGIWVMKTNIFKKVNSKKLTKNYEIERKSQNMHANFGRIYVHNYIEGWSKKLFSLWTLPKSWDCSKIFLKWKIWKFSNIISFPIISF